MCLYEYALSLRICVYSSIKRITKHVKEVDRF